MAWTFILTLYILKAGMIAAIIKINDITEKAFPCAFIYGLLHFVFALVWGWPLKPALIKGGSAFVAAGVLFWLMGRARESWLFWPVLGVTCALLLWYEGQPFV